MKEPGTLAGYAAYLAARTRKLTLSDQMLETVSQPGYENFHVLIGITG